MIKVFEDIKEAGQVELRTGDRLRLPIDMSWARSCETYSFEVYRRQDQDCITENVEVPYGNIAPFKCSTHGQFRVRVANYDESGDKQFAIYLGDRKFGRGFRGKSASLSEYMDKIVKHFKKTVKGWMIERSGGILTFRSKSPCAMCGTPVSIGLGGYNILNRNNPCISAVPDGTAMVTGYKCYSLMLADIREGNRVIINGITYTALKSESAREMRERILNGSECLRVINGVSLTIFTEPGTVSVSNTNNPRLTLTYSHSDTSKDYYTAAAYDVREGNIFNINGIQIVASASDTPASISAVYNTQGGYFAVDLGASTAISVIAGTRQISNANNPTATATMVEDVPNQTMDKYTVSICGDVVAGNFYNLDGRAYVARAGDTAIDVAYALAGENMAVFNYYTPQGDGLEVSVERGFQVTEDNLASVTALCETVQCCDKKSWILEFDAEEPGCYTAVFRDQTGRVVRYTDLINVSDHAEGVTVEFGNSHDAYGWEFDSRETFSMRLPLWLNDATPETYEEIFENTRGEQVRGVTRIFETREFITKPISAQMHSTIVRILKSESLVIDGAKYTFIGEYELPPRRPGVSDKRMAKGLLRSNTAAASNDNTCKAGC